MDDPSPIQFTPASAKRISDVVRQIEVLPVSSAAGGAPQGTNRPFDAWGEITGSSTVSGISGMTLYPGLIYYHDLGADTWTSAGNAVWLHGANAETLVSNKRYRSFASGANPADGVTIFDAIVPSSSGAGTSTGNSGDLQAADGVGGFVNQQTFNASSRCQTVFCTNGQFLYDTAAAGATSGYAYHWRSSRAGGTNNASGDRVALLDFDATASGNGNANIATVDVRYVGNGTTIAGKMFIGVNGGIGVEQNILLDGTGAPGFVNITVGLAIDDIAFFGGTPVARPATSAGHGAIAGAAYGANEQKMLQDVFSALESLNLMA